MKKILVFDTDLKGHHLEYLHHIYMGATSNQQLSYYFCVPASFNKIKDKFDWPESKNISFLFLSETDLKKCNKKSLLIGAWHKSILVRKLVNQYGIDNVWLIMFMYLMPFLPFLIPRSVKITGVIYRLYFYEGNNMSILRLIIEKFRYFIIAKSKNIDKVLILNDEHATLYLNRVYNTGKFMYLPDPVPDLKKYELYDIRKELGIEDSDKVFLHFGGLNYRKGTLDIMNAIQLVPETHRTNMVFIFAGVIMDEIKSEFYRIYKKVEKNTRIIVFDEFCSYELLANLCNCTDFILLPYKNTNQSSGVIGYSAYYRKIVIGPSTGLLGNIIKKYEMGLSLEDLSPLCLSKLFISLNKSTASSSYVNSHDVNDFIKSWY